MKKSFLVHLIAFLIALSLVAPMPMAFAATVSDDAPMDVNVGAYDPDQQIYISDLADLLTREEENELIELSQYFVENYDLNVLFLTTNDANNKSTMVYSDDYMDALFPKGVDNNIAFVIDMDNRDYYINTMGIAISKLSDSDIDTALDKAYGAMKAGDYASAFKKMAEHCLSDITGKSAAMRDGFAAALLGAMLSQTLLWSLIPTALVVIVLIIQHNAANKVESATRYLSPGDYKVIDKDETFMSSYETVQRDYYKPKSSSGGGGSSHRSSSGRSHGGGGRSF